MNRKSFLGLTLGLVFSLAAGNSHAAAPAPLKIGYSDWPGWVAWQVAIDKGWLQKADFRLPADAAVRDAPGLSPGDAEKAKGSGRFVARGLNTFFAMSICTGCRLHAPTQPSR